MFKKYEFWLSAFMYCIIIFVWNKYLFWTYSTSWIHQISCFSVVFDIISLRILISLKLNILFNLCLYTYYSIPVVTWHALYTCKVEIFFIFPTQQTFFTIFTRNFYSGGNFCLHFSFLKKTRFVISVVWVIVHTITSIFHTVQEKTLVNN